MPIGITSLAKNTWGNLWWLGLLLLFIGIVTNFGTAALRLPALVSSPVTVDGASYYVGAWAMRMGLSPYVWSPETLRLAGEQHGVTLTPTPPGSPTPWVWMYQILTVFSYPAVAWVWLLILVAIVIYSTRLLVQIAGDRRWKTTLIVLPFTLTFGPTVLNLTIGQNALVVLLGALLLGRYLGGKSSRGSALLTWLLAVSAKIYPVIWLALLLFLRRWRMLVVSIAVCVLLFGVIALLEPAADRDYWFNCLLKRGREVTDDINIDDQSIGARVELLGRENRISLHSLDPQDREEIVWSPPFEIPARSLRVISLIITIGLGAILVRTWWLADQDRFNEGLLYLLVLFSLLPIPHMERYNHVAILPAMAWLWKWDKTSRLLIVLAYCLVGISRLNHLWAAILAWPWGPLATGTSVYAILILGGGIVRLVTGGSSGRLTDVEV
jgi:hypothetical protein